MNVYEIVTDKIVKQLEAGMIPWRRPWATPNGEKSLPINYVTRQPYHGINLLLLPYGGEYLTYKQVVDAGGNVKKGEKANIVTFWKQLDRVNDDGKIEMIPFLRYYSVFHITQCDNVKSKIKKDVNTSIDFHPIIKAEEIFDSYIAREKIAISEEYGLDAAYYPSRDKITLPPRQTFTSEEHYYSVAFHEIVHSTGHEKRLNRIDKSATSFSRSTEYSKEELVAEIGAAYVANIAGFDTESVFDNSAAYIANWASVLKKDVRIVIAAAGAAQKAVDYILNA